MTSAIVRGPCRALAVSLRISIMMPLPHCSVPSQHRAMILITDQRTPDRFEALPARRLDALLARLLAPSLDRKLAAGCPPETHRLLAIRAQALVGAGMRRPL